MHILNLRVPQIDPDPLKAANLRASCTSEQDGIQPPGIHYIFHG